MQITLTPEDRAAIQAAADILKRLCVGPVRSANIGFIKQGEGGFFTATAHDHHGSFSFDRYPRRSAELAEGFGGILDKLAQKNPDEETRKAQRVAELREQLARLEAEDAA